MLLQKCGKCHGNKRVNRGLDLSTMTDEIGWQVVENRVSVADWHATSLHLLGMNHEELFFELHGFSEKLTGGENIRVV